MATVQEQLMAVGVSVLPEAIKLLKDAFKKKNPTEPEPADTEVLAVYHQLVQDELAHDAHYLATHPAEPGPDGHS